MISLKDDTIKQDYSVSSNVSHSRTVDTTLLSVPEGSSSDGSAKQLSKRHSSEEKQECSVAEIKLPSYVSISCAINGYTSYGRFCRSRDNSPARFPSSSSPVKNSEAIHSLKFTNNSITPMAGQISDSNRKVCYKESKEVFIGKQLEIPVVNGNATQISCNLDRTCEKSYDVTDRVVNGHGEEKGILLETLQEIGGASSKHKSLVMQRIESLYGHTSEMYKIHHRNSRLLESVDKSNYSMKRSPSCPPQVTRNPSRSPPVFRHLTKDFREQLRENGSMLHTNTKHGKKLTGEVSGLPLNTSSTIKSTSGLKTDSSQLPLSPKISFEKDGHHFLSCMELEKGIIGQKIAEFEKYLDDTSIPEDVCGKIRSAIGKASLLLSQKFEQFRKLCERNINKDSEPIPTSSDLEGFWDMVLLQVTDVKNTFIEINRIKENNWQEILSPKEKVRVRPKYRKQIPPGLSKSNPTTPNRSTKSSELSKAREEARRQLMEAKRKGRQQNAVQEPEAEIAIFVPRSANGH